MKKKTLAVLSGLAVVSASLAGCGSAGDQGAASTGKPEASAAPTVKEPVTIKVNGWYKLQGANNGNWDLLVEHYNQTHPGVKVVYEPLVDNGNSNDAMKKMDLLAASGETLDVVLINAPMEYSKRVEAGLLAPLDEFLQKDNVNPRDDYKIDTAINGKYYALPGKSVDWLILLNKDMLDKANLPIPQNWTWDDYAEYAKKLTANEGAQKVYGSYFHTWIEYAKLAVSNDPDNPQLYKADGTVNVDMPRVRFSLELRNRMENIDKTSVPYTDTISQKLNYTDVFYSGKAAMIPTGNWMVSSLATNARFNTAVAPWPKYNANDPDGYAQAGSDLVAVGANSKHKQEAYDFVRWYTTEGINMQGFFSSWKKADTNAILDLTFKTGKPESVQLIDRTSLLRVLQNGKAAPTIMPPSYASQMESEYIKQMELYLLGKQDLDTMIKNAAQKMNDVRNSNK